jgi:transposase-like protein
MKRLDFGSYSSTEWEEFKRIHREMFWEELEEATLREAKRILQEQVDEEFELQIGAKRFERTPGRRDERNGTRIRAYEITAGRIAELVIPRARKLDIRFTVFEQWQRVQPKVLAALLKAYLLSRSASCAAEIAEAFGQSRFSRSFLRRLVRGFEERLHGFHRRSLQNWPYVFIDGMAVKVRDVRLRDKMVIFAIGMDDEHRWEVLGWVVADHEDECSVRGLLGDLKRRGLTDPKLFISDDAAGILSALRLEYPHAAWQSCAFHKISGIQRHLKHIANRKEILREAGDIYALSQTRTQAISRFDAFRSKWRRREPEAVRLFARGFEDTLRYFDFPRHMWISLYTNNPMEQFIGKLRSWTDRYNYFQGQTNLELSIYTYVCHKNGELVSDSARSSSAMTSERVDQNPTLIVA